MHFSLDFHLLSGLVGQLRFCLRKDADPSSYGTCNVEELAGFEPHGCDVMLFAKRHMADTTPCKVIVLVAASQCVALRNAFQQPTGLTPKRPISLQVSKNIEAFAPRCMRQSIISADACSYLQAWIAGTLPQIPRPTQYRCLNLRRYDINAPPVGPNAWVPPRRARNITVLDGNDVSDSDEDEGAVVLDE